MADVVALIDDLFFHAKLMETAKQLSVELRTCTTPDSLLTEVTAHTPRLVVVDLNARNNPLDAIKRLAQNAQSVPLIAFLSHVQTDLADRARAAGCANVMPRSKFTRDLATIFAQAKSQALGSGA